MTKAKELLFVNLMVAKKGRMRSYDVRITDALRKCLVEIQQGDYLTIKGLGTLKVLLISGQQTSATETFTSMVVDIKCRLVSKKAYSPKRIQRAERALRAQELNNIVGR